MKAAILSGACVLVITMAGFAGAQTTLNPDISVIGDIRGQTGDRPEELGLEQKWNYELHEVELAAQGYLNPYARGDVFLAWHEDAAHAEEAYVTFERGLPWGLSMRAGRYLADFGRLNLLHPHAWSFIEQPLVHVEYFGDHGFNDDGVSLRWLLPITSLYVQMSADLLRGRAFVGEHEHSHEGDPEVQEESPPDKGFLAHLSVAGATGEFAETAGGVSFAYGHCDPVENLRSILWGADLKHKYKPSRYTSLTVMAEAIVNRREIEAHHHEDQEAEEEVHDTSFENFFGTYAFVDYQFKQRFNLGAKIDHVQPLEDKDNSVMQYQAFVGFSPVEETSLIRLSGFYRKPAKGDGAFGALVQLIFSLGPHRPHYF